LSSFDDLESNTTTPSATSQSPPAAVDRDINSSKSEGHKARSNTCKSNSTTPKRHFKQDQPMRPYQKTQKNKCTIFDFESSHKEQKVKASGQLVLSALQDITKTLNKLVDRVEGTEKDLKYVKEKLHGSPSSSSDSSVSKRSHFSVPRNVRVSMDK